MYEKLNFVGFFAKRLAYETKNYASSSQQKKKNACLFTYLLFEVTDTDPQKITRSYL